MKRTEINVTRLDEIEPGLRIIEKIHPPNEKYPDPSHQLIAGIKGGGKAIFTDKKPIR